MTTESEFVSYLIGALIVAYFTGYQWGKYARIIKDLGRWS